MVSISPLACALLGSFSAITPIDAILFDAIFQTRYDAMAATLRRLTDMGSFSILQEKLDNWLNVYDVSYYAFLLPFCFIACPIY